MIEIFEEKNSAEINCQSVSSNADQDTGGGGDFEGRDRANGRKQTTQLTNTAEEELIG